jgi:hypothetical protein
MKTISGDPETGVEAVFTQEGDLVELVVRGRDVNASQDPLPERHLNTERHPRSISPESTGTGARTKRSRLRAAAIGVAVFPIVLGVLAYGVGV